MSFDTTFDYTEIVDRLNGRITELVDERDTANSMLSVIGNLPSQYQVLAADEIDYYTNLIPKINTDIGNFGNVVGEISIVQSLDGNTKNTIYDFFTTYTDGSTLSRVDWMRRMVYHMPDIANDIGNLMMDGSITSSEAQCVANLICRYYEPVRQTTGFSVILHQKFSS